MTRNAQLKESKEKSQKQSKRERKVLQSSNIEESHLKWMLRVALSPREGKTREIDHGKLRLLWH